MILVQLTMESSTEKAVLAAQAATITALPDSIAKAIECSTAGMVLSVNRVDQLTGGLHIVVEIDDPRPKAHVAIQGGGGEIGYMMAKRIVDHYGTDDDPNNRIGVVLRRSEGIFTASNTLT